MRRSFERTAFAFYPHHSPHKILKTSHFEEELLPFILKHPLSYKPLKCQMNLNPCSVSCQRPLRKCWWVEKRPTSHLLPTFQQLLVISPISTNLRCDSTRAARFKTGILRLKKNFNEFPTMMLMFGITRESLVNCMA